MKLKLINPIRCYHFELYVSSKVTPMLDQSSNRPAIILAEDEPDILAILHRLVRNLVPHYEVITVGDGSTALEQLKQRPVPLVIADYNMHGMTGLQIT